MRRIGCSILKHGFLIWIMVLFGCPGQSAGETDARSEPEPYEEGEIHAGGERLAVVPFILHSREMDLGDQCRTARDASRDAGGEQVPLCYDPERRPGFDRVRIEYVPRLRGGQAMQLLAADHEAAHFLVERSGAITQVLDLAHAPRRDGALRGDEVRVISGHEEGHQRLIEALKAHYPDLEVEVVRPMKEEEGKRDPDAEAR